MSRPWRSLPAASGLVLCLVALAVFWARHEDTRIIDVPAVGGPRDRPVELAPVEVEVAWRDPVEGPAEDLPPEVDSPPASGADRTLDVAGWVLESDGVGVGGATVHLRARHGTEHSGTANTEPDGRFELSLDADEWRIGELANVHVSLASGERLFTGVVALGRDLTILLPRALLLSGRVTGMPPSMAEDVSARFDVAAGGRFATNLFVATTVLDDRGEFALLARLPAASDDLQISFFRGSTPLAVVRRRVAELTAPGGGEIDLDLVRIRIAIENKEGLPVEDVQVGISPLRQPDSLVRLTAVSGPDGRIDLVLPRGEAEACASHEDYATRVWVVEPAVTNEPVETIVLSRLDEEATLEGKVFLADGSPLPGVTVSVFPRSRTGVAFGARVVASTSEDGEFSVPVRSDGPLEVVTRHTTHGKGPRTLLQPGTREVRIQFDGQGEVVLELDVAATAMVTRPGPIECLLVDRSRVNSIQRHVWGTPSPLGGVPAGAYNLFVFWPGMDVLGTSPLTVADGETAYCRIVLTAARWLEGTIVDGSGRALSGASVQLAPDPWSPGSEHAWSKTTSTSDGSFRLLLPRDLESIDFVVSTTDGRSARWSGTSGPAYVVLAD